MGLNYEKERHIVKVGMNRPKERNAPDSQILLTAGNFNARTSVRGAF